MRYAIFSDIHNDAVALAKMLEHALTQRIDSYFCLGDVGIDECVNQVRAVSAPTIFGNWEASSWYALSPENQRWALALPAMIKTDEFWLTHAAPLWPEKLATLAHLNADPYAVARSRLFPYLHTESELMWETVALLSEANVSLMFHGHTHRQMVWQFSADNQLNRLPKSETYKSNPGNVLIVGVGSVGRPVDGPGAAYVIYDTDVKTVEMVRVL